MSEIIGVVIAFTIFFGVGTALLFLMRETDDE